MELLNNSGFCALIGTMIGSLTTLIATFYTNKCGSDEQREERKERKIALLLQGQVDELSALSEHLAKWGRATFLYYNSILKQIKECPNGTIPILGDSDADEMIRSEVVSISHHRGRILDERLRKAVYQLTGDVCTSNNAEEVSAFLNDKMIETGKVQEMISRQYREMLTIGLSDDEIAFTRDRP